MPEANNNKKNKKKKDDKNQHSEEIRVNLPAAPTKDLKKEKTKETLRKISGALRFIYYPESNEIRTSKYTIVNFLFLALYEEFKKPSNIWFLIIAVITLTPASPVPANQFIVFFIFVLFVGLLKAGIEDIMRHKADDRVNLQPVNVIRDGTEKRIKWKNILPGDIIKVKSGEEFPADMVLISSAEASGICYVSTANLDGETTLKTKQAVKSLHHLNTNEQLSTLKMKINAEHPSPKVDTFSAYLNVIEGSDVETGTNASIAVDHNNLLIRSTVLKNTEYIYGVVIYSGRKTKYALNTNDKARHRRSHLERKLDRYVIGIAATSLGLTAIYTVLGVIYYIYYIKGKHWYIEDNYSTGELAALSFFSFLAVISGLVPLALYITLDIVRLIQMYIISHDPKLYDEEKEMRATSKSANLHEELGQIKYIFSDKTGTLTKNKMIFRTARIGQRVFGSAKIEEPVSQKFQDFNEQFKLPHMEHFHWEDEEMMEQLVSLSQIKSCEGKIKEITL
jgi:phospholipid-transporting ATPase